MTITIKSNPDGVSGAVQVNGIDKVTIGASGITAGSFAPNSIDAAAAALAFSGANQSLASSGYQKLPSGLIIQWGTTPALGTTPVAVTFAIAFPSICVSVALTNAAATNINVAALNRTTTKFDGWASSGGNQHQYVAIGY